MKVFLLVGCRRLVLTLPDLLTTCSPPLLLPPLFSAPPSPETPPPPPSLILHARQFCASPGGSCVKRQMRRLWRESSGEDGGTELMAMGWWEGVLALAERVGGGRRRRRSWADGRLLIMREVKCGEELGGEEKGEGGGGWVGSWG